MRKKKAGHGRLSDFFYTFVTINKKNIFKGTTRNAMPLRARQRDYSDFVLQNFNGHLKKQDRNNGSRQPYE